MDSFLKVLDPPAGKGKTSLGNKSNYVKTVSVQCLNSISTLSGQCLEGGVNYLNQKFFETHFCKAQSIWTEINLIHI